jgi:hypothetical protein
MSGSPAEPVSAMRAWRLALGATGLVARLFGRTRQHEAEREKYNRAASRLVAQRELAGALHVLAWRAQRAAETSIVW